MQCNARDDDKSDCYKVQERALKHTTTKIKQICVVILNTKAHPTELNQMETTPHNSMIKLVFDLIDKHDCIDGII